ncbi:Uncharacterised protein [Sphingobacterium multivorum]|uniref:Uncharacterized protein n=1 Tax=Sphingobacterium multivorum TaxID=28454 RepID=A0A2X2JID0_SPHMU|nr:Uncharacterised protein [Sphingobacterium multivorum]SUJ02863.1 Uncharacterised protein [Sphingobacterium multivorum]VXC54684.1 conserved hypothetical protein [Sphingobacterium multivorum]
MLDVRYGYASQFKQERGIKSGSKRLEKKTKSLLSKS